MLFGDVIPSTVDYKISLNQEDEDLKRYNYLAYKISSKNLSKEICEKDKSLVYCIIENDKIKLSPLNKEGETPEVSYDIIIDSYPLLDTTDDFELNSSIENKTILFPIQLATGKIRKISIQSAQHGGTLRGGYIGVYANELPTAIGAKLIFDTNSTNAIFDDQGICRFDVEGKTMPEIEGYWTDSNGVDHQNTFLYILFYMEQEKAGYKILTRKTSDLENIESLGTTIYGQIKNFNREFHEFFDYVVDTNNLDQLNVPYINFTMEI